MNKPQPFPCYEPDLVRAHLDDFGLFSVTVDVAAELVALELWTLDEFPEIKKPENFDGNPFDPRLLATLRPQIEQQKQRLIVAIDAQRLPIEIESRNLDERLDASCCYVSLHALIEWLLARGVDSDITRRYQESLATACELICDGIERLQFMARSSTEMLGEWYPPIRLDVTSGESSAKGDVSEINPDQASHYELLVENQRLRDQLTQLGVQPKEEQLKTSERNTLHRLLIAMAMKGFGWDTKKRNSAANDIVKALQDVGLNMEADTVRKYLQKAGNQLPQRGSWLSEIVRR
ncbi:hypothetical protein [Paraburkholderia caffeinilytica]|uniref:hypothetical protein n=1 Tax=Paraburkholderia caffeinilytica TaxID=1761016 RepID=UPI0038BC5214